MQKRIKNYTLSTLSLLLFVLLFWLTINGYNNIITKNVAVYKLLENPEGYEGNEVVVSQKIVVKLDGEYLFLKDWGGKNALKVKATQTELIEINAGDIITVAGESRLSSQGYLTAQSVHVHKNPLLKILISLFGLIPTAYFLYKEKVIKFRIG
jgi:hypothetical protein